MHEGGRLELLSGFEPETSSLPRKCSTPELQQRGETQPEEECLQRNDKKQGLDRGAAADNRAAATDGLERVMGIEPT